MDVTPDRTVELLERHAAGQLGRDEVLSELAAADPRVGLMTRLIALGRPEAADDEDAEATEARVALEHALQASNEARRLADAVRREFDGVSAELAELRNRLDDVAAALGACPGCWGDDRDCGWCRGRGRPGVLTPDPDAFDRLVLPAVRARAAIRRRAGGGDGIGTDERRTA